jgi:hypothetical protein
LTENAAFGDAPQYGCSQDETEQKCSSFEMVITARGLDDRSFARIESRRMAIRQKRRSSEPEESRKT